LVWSIRAVERAIVGSVGMRVMSGRSRDSKVLAAHFSTTTRTAILTVVIAVTPHRPIALSFVSTSTRSKVVAVAVGSLLIALSAQLRVDLPFSPVPVTGQTFAVLLVSATLGARLAFSSVGAYLIEGLLGAPVFAGGTAGPAVFAGPTGGYLVGFAVAALAVGHLADRGWERRVVTAVPALLVGEIAIYLVGLPWLARFVGSEVIAVGLVPFVVGDAYKLIAAAIALPIACALLGTRRPSPNN
jgi:biotin transport system substrate-specific component